MQLAKHLRKLGSSGASLFLGQQPLLVTSVLQTAAPQRTLHILPDGPSLQDFLRPSPSTPAVLVRRAFEYPVFCSMQ